MADRNTFIATVRANQPLCHEHYRLVLRLPKFPSTDPGQFMQIECRAPAANDLDEREIEIPPGVKVGLHNRELVAPLAFLRRPFSLAGRRDARDGVELDIIHRVVGVGTDWLAHLKGGDQVDILGPLGNRFELPRKDGRAILVGGGVGIPPMLYLASYLSDHDAIAFCGAVSKDLLPLKIIGATNPLKPGLNIAEFAAHGVRSVITTDDGSYGFRGFVTDALESWLSNSIGNRQSEIGNITLYTCGPEPMMKRVAQIAAQRNIECQVAVERAMACGMGTCQSCCIRVRKPDRTKPPLVGQDWCWRLACTDGPIFRGADLLW
jgi:dihydroorotate dehydrogenase electron transfer subunit